MREDLAEFYRFDMGNILSLGLRISNFAAALGDDSGPIVADLGTSRGSGDSIGIGAILIAQHARVG